jgi:UDP-glucose 4-epimerase
MIIGDILDMDQVNASVANADVVYNFAGIADIDEASQKPIDSVKFNILGNTIILEACRKAKVKRYVFASSIYVYSKEGSIYRSTKQACELLIENYQDLCGLAYTILRYGSLYGPRADERNAIHSFIHQALTHGRIQRYGDGEELREYIHVHDAARGSVDILSDEFANQHVIITGYQQMRVRDVLFMIREMMEQKIDIEFLPPNENYHYEITPYSFAPRVGRRLNCRSYLDLGQGILDMVYTQYSEKTPMPIVDRLLSNKNHAV